MKIIKFNYNLFFAFAFALLSVGCGTSPSEIPPNPYSDWVRENLLGKVRSIELIRTDEKDPTILLPKITYYDSLGYKTRCEDYYEEQTFRIENYLYQYPITFLKTDVYYIEEKTGEYKYEGGESIIDDHLKNNLDDDVVYIESGPISPRYNASGRLIGIVWNDGDKVTSYAVFSYNKNGQCTDFKIYREDTLRHHDKLTYDEKGYLHLCTYGYYGTQVADILYRPDGKAERIIWYPKEEGCEEEIYHYDAQNRLTEAFKYNSYYNRYERTTYHYDTNNHCIADSITHNGVLNQTNRYAYDRYGNLTLREQKDYEGDISTTLWQYIYCYDKIGNWIEKNTYKDKNNIKTIRRKITYY